jgi:hypothetical protein
MAKAKKLHIQFIDQNTKGRDFIIGDIHGCFDELQKLLSSVAFDHSVDRLISVGDLVDRGPKNIEVLKFFLQHYGKSVFAVKGNHDEMFEMNVLNMMDTSYEYSSRVDWGTLRRNGTAWIDELFHDTKSPDREEHIDVLKKAAKMVETFPYILVSGKGTSNRYNVVHTEFIRKHPKPRMIEGFSFYGWGKTVDTLQPYHGHVTDEHIDEWDVEAFRSGGIYSMWDDAFAWKRDIFNTPINGRQQKAGKMSVTYSGHNALKTGQPVKIQQQILIDTSAGYIYRESGPEKDLCRLSMIDHSTHEVHQVDGNMNYLTNTVDYEWFDGYRAAVMENFKKKVAAREARDKEEALRKEATVVTATTSPVKNDINEFTGKW